MLVYINTQYKESRKTDPQKKIMNFASALKGCLTNQPAVEPVIPPDQVPPGWLHLARRGRQFKEGPPGSRAAYLDQCEWEYDVILSRNMFNRRVQAQIDDLVRERVTLGDLSPRWHVYPEDVLEYYVALQEQDEQDEEDVDYSLDVQHRSATAKRTQKKQKKWRFNKATQQWSFFLPG
jgi:hypothetical protein